MAFQLLYMSRATAEITEAGLKEILTVSRDRNQMQEITGLLLYGERHFFQILEGDETPVGDVFARILTDPRHEAHTVIATRTLAHRSFPDWSMGYRSLARGTPDDMAAFHDLRRLEDLDSLPAGGDDLFRVMRSMYAANA